MQIIGYHVGDGIIANSDSEYCVEQPFLDFLLEPKANSIKVFYHMGDSVAKLLKMLNVWEEEGRKLQNEGELRMQAYLIKHRAGKFFSVKKGKYWDSPFGNFGDMSQYEPARHERLREDDREDCIAKAQMAKKTGEAVYTTLRRIGTEPKSLTSPINIYNKQVLEKIGLPTIDDMPEEAGYYAYQCCQGSWLEAFQIGHWDMAYDYDMNSAYSSELMKLLDIRLGEWIKSEKWVDGAEYGFLKGMPHILKPISPVIFTGKNPAGSKLNFTPTGKFPRYISMKKVMFMRECGVGDFAFEDGWFWVPKERRLVLSNLIGQLHREKEASAGISREVIKRIMSGIWGKFLQVQEDGFGDMFNPVYGAEVESNIRQADAEFIYYHGIDPIHVSVDGVISPVEVELDKENKGMGRWELSSAAPCICAGTATVAIQGKRGAADFSIDYDWLLNEIKKNPDASEYSLTKVSPVTLAVALNGEWNKLGDLREVTKVISLGEEQKRCYREQPASGIELLSKHYGSEPWDVSLLSDPTEIGAEAEVSEE